MEVGIYPFVNCLYILYGHLSTADRGLKEYGIQKDNTYRMLAMSRKAINLQHACAHAL
jgi:hypothetical protein